MSYPMVVLLQLNKNNDEFLIPTSPLFRRSEKVHSKQRRFGCILSIASSTPDPTLGLLVPLAQGSLIYHVPTIEYIRFGLALCIFSIHGLPYSYHQDLAGVFSSSYHLQFMHSWFTIFGPLGTSNSQKFSLGFLAFLVKVPKFTVRVSTNTPDFAEVYPRILGFYSIPDSPCSYHRVHPTFGGLFFGFWHLQLRFIMLVPSSTTDLASLFSGFWHLQLKYSWFTMLVPSITLEPQQSILGLFEFLGISDSSFHKVHQNSWVYSRVPGTFSSSSPCSPCFYYQ